MKDVKTEKNLKAVEQLETALLARLKHDDFFHLSNTFKCGGILSASFCFASHLAFLIQFHRSEVVKPGQTSNSRTPDHNTMWIPEMSIVSEMSKHNDATKRKKLQLLPYDDSSSRPNLETWTGHGTLIVWHAEEHPVPPAVLSIWNAEQHLPPLAP